jgi:hypothetical protein
MKVDDFMDVDLLKVFGYSCNISDTKAANNSSMRPQAWVDLTSVLVSRDARHQQSGKLRSRQIQKNDTLSGDGDAGKTIFGFGGIGSPQQIKKTETGKRGACCSVRGGPFHSSIGIVCRLLILSVTVVSR